MNPESLMAGFCTNPVSAVKIAKPSTLVDEGVCVFDAMNDMLRFGGWVMCPRLMYKSLWKINRH